MPPAGRSRSFCSPPVAMPIAAAWPVGGGGRPQVKQVQALSSPQSLQSPGPRPSPLRPAPASPWPVRRWAAGPWESEQFWSLWGLESAARSFHVYPCMWLLVGPMLMTFEWRTTRHAPAGCPSHRNCHPRSAAVFGTHLLRRNVNTSDTSFIYSFHLYGWRLKQPVGGGS